MASEHIVRPSAQIQRQFGKGLQILLDMFHDAILLYTQDIQVVNFSNINKGLVYVIIMYKTLEGRSVKLEAVDAIDETSIP